MCDKCKWSARHILHEEDYEPFDKVRKGDIILLNDRPRTVHAVSRSCDDAVRSIYVPILRRSWTNRPYTVISRSDIKFGNYKFGGIIARRKDKDLCSTEVECLVHKEIKQRGVDKRYIYADEMVGLVW